MCVCAHIGVLRDRDHVCVCAHIGVLRDRDHVCVCPHWSTEGQRPCVCVCPHWSAEGQRPCVCVCPHWSAEGQRPCVCVPTCSVVLPCCQKKNYLFCHYGQNILETFLIHVMHMYTVSCISCSMHVLYTQ